MAGDALSDAVGHAIRYAQLTEALGSTLSLLAALVQQVEHIHEIDPDLVPELQAVMLSMVEIGAALGAAANFVEARFEVAREKLGEAARDA